jgi:hypothetical protein
MSPGVTQSSHHCQLAMTSGAHVHLVAVPRSTECIFNLCPILQRQRVEESLNTMIRESTESAKRQEAYRTATDTNAAASVLLKCSLTSCSCSSRLLISSINACHPKSSISFIAITVHLAQRRFVVMMTF